MEHAQPSYTAPTYTSPAYTSPAYTAPAYQAPQMPMPMPQQQPVYQQPLSPKAMMTAPMAMPAQVVPKPSQTNIHLHTSYQQTTFIVPPPRPKPVMVSCYSDVGAVLVLFILLVIITRCFPKF
ncbi:hypothetical protein [Paenibacillus sp. GP183]|uniref:hypothetical protein n=1 Tax=Paenibacillus sp. GP183 TaxID=1882751 RepID=UPI0008946C65|nr:hypothetical protein [Paenibacillus sp. GP183]SEC57819.1 hypothetical protein SAMN05443246_4585 [Paenibacillus sp. GP183]